MVHNPHMGSTIPYVVVDGANRIVHLILQLSLRTGPSPGPSVVESRVLLVLLLPNAGFIRSIKSLTASSVNPPSITSGDATPSCR